MWMVTNRHLVLNQTLVVATQWGDKDGDIDVIRSMNPFLSFTSGTTNIDNFKDLVPWH